MMEIRLMVMALSLAYFVPIVDRLSLELINVAMRFFCLSRNDSLKKQIHRGIGETAACHTNSLQFECGLWFVVE